jgi:hypothetical protein
MRRAQVMPLCLRNLSLSGIRLGAALAIILLDGDAGHCPRWAFVRSRAIICPAERELSCDYMGVGPSFR